MKNKMRNLFIVLIMALTSMPVFAYKSGTVTCQFEFVLKDTPNETKRSEKFSFPLGEQYGNTFNFSFLSSPILMKYYPGVTKQGDITYLTFLLKYEDANAGADSPIVKDAFYYTNISKDDTNLLGAFMKCVPVNLK